VTKNTFLSLVFKIILFNFFHRSARCFSFLKKIIFADMKIRLLAIGKTDDKSLQTLTTVYAERLKHYVRFELTIIPDIKNVKNLSQKQQKEKEGSLLLSKLQTGDQLIVLDEKGKDFRSIEFSNFLQKKMNSGIKQLVFVIGGPYGFSEEVYKRAQGKVSLSKMTFSHQMIRLFFTEQVYRAFTILKNEPYHHE
jgi:23S rRNA (pseudouridine1915-N3)-methyltransferase